MKVSSAPTSACGTRPGAAAVRREQLLAEVDERDELCADLVTEVLGGVAAVPEVVVPDDLARESTCRRTIPGDIVGIHAPDHDPDPDAAAGGEPMDVEWSLEAGR